MKGRVLTAQGGFYDVYAQDDVYTCRLRGKNKQGMRVAVAGDCVDIETAANGTGTIEAIHPRKNLLHRPTIANIDQLLILSALKDPPTDFMLIDRLLVLSAHHQIDPLLVFNKLDLSADTRRIKDYYRDFFPIFIISAETGAGIADLSEKLHQKITALAGHSGVGKSSLINRLTGISEQSTAAVSDKLRRGRHTTRASRFIPYREGFLVDTPGFNVLHLPEDLSAVQLAGLYPDLSPYADECRYRDCLHRNEPDCAVKAAVEADKISADRYHNYCLLLSELN